MAKTTKAMEQTKANTIENETNMEETMKTIVTVTEENGKYYLNDNGTVTEITKMIFDKKQQKNVLKLPENSTGRQWVVVDKIKEAGGTYEIKSINKTSEPIGNKSLRDWLSPDDQKIYDELVDKANANKEAYKEAHKKQPMSEADKLRAKIAKEQAKLDALLKGIQ